MPQFDIPIVIPYRLDGEAETALYSVQVKTISSSAPEAMVSAQVLTRALAALRHPDRKAILLPDRAKAGVVGPQLNGPFAYVLTRGPHIRHLSFPARIDNQLGEVIGKAFSNLEPETLYGVVIDCGELIYINSSGLASIASHLKRLRLRLFNVSPTIYNIFELVGLSHILPIHPDLATCLNGLVKEISNPSE
jgi:anti-anti-sigma factor